MVRIGIALAVETELSEAEHLQHALTDAGLVEDMDENIGLVFPLPDNAQIVRIVSGYDTRTTTNLRVRCSACKQHQLHNRGFRVQLEGGWEARIGFDCGERHFGAGTWQTAVADFDRREKNAVYVARIKPALDSIQRTMPLIKEWHDRTNLFGKWVTAFQSEMPQLFKRLGDEAKLRDGRLERQRKRKQSSVDRQGTIEQRTAYETIEIGRIPYPEMFRGSSPNHGLNAAKTSLGLAVALFEHKRDTGSLTKAFAHIRDAQQHLRDAAEVHSRILLNLDLRWLPSLCDWANRDEHLEATYEATDGGLVHDEQRRNESFSFLKRDTIGLPSLDQISALWA